MNAKNLLSIIFVTGFILYGCGGAPITPAETGQVAVQDQVGLISALQVSGAKVEVTDTVYQDFFSPEGSLMQVDGMDIQVFEYETAEAMESEALQVASDGSSVGTSMMMWMDAPHFFKSGRIIVLYVGSDENTLTLLKKTIGSQFAGQ